MEHTHEARRRREEAGLGERGRMSTVTRPTPPPTGWVPPSGDERERGEGGDQEGGREQVDPYVWGWRLGKVRIIPK